MKLRGTRDRKATPDREARGKTSLQDECGCFSLVLDRAGRLLPAGGSLHRYLGYSAREISAKTLPDLVVPGRRRELKEILDLAEGPAVFTAYTELRHKSGPKYPVMLRLEACFEGMRRTGFRGLGGFIDVPARGLPLLTGRILRAQDAERRRIARELHDTTGQNIQAMLLNHAVLSREMHLLSPAAQRALSENMQLASACAHEVRTLAYLLHPRTLDELGLAPALRTYLAGYEERTGIQVSADLPEGDARLPLEMETALFRVVQEGLSNIFRHSGTRRASLRLKHDARRIVVELRDYGRGFGQAGRFGPPETGVGIPAMRERLRPFGGELTFASANPGTRLTATLPLQGAVSQQNVDR